MNGCKDVQQELFLLSVFGSSYKDCIVCVCVWAGTSQGTFCFTAEIKLGVAKPHSQFYCI